jgi:hypothetical protein
MIVIGCDQVIWKIATISINTLNGGTVLDSLENVLGSNELVEILEFVRQ